MANGEKKKKNSGGSEMALKYQNEKLAYGVEREKRLIGESSGESGIISLGRRK
jgi:hypothetical protein